MLTFSGVSFDYAGVPLLENLSFSVPEGALVSLLGKSGCGKSTVFRLINGLEQAKAGEIRIKGKRIGQEKRRTGFMPQKDLLFPWRTVEENLALPLEGQGLSRSVRRERVQEKLEEIGLLEYAKAYPSALSGGMRQRVSFARTLLLGADLLLLDEPFSALDALTRIEMQSWLLSQWERHPKTILFITHDAEEAIFLSQKVYVMRGQPVRQMETFDVPLPYPRSRNDLKKEETLRLREMLIEKVSP